MKKNIYLLITTLVLSVSSYCQNVVGTSCTCVVPNNSTCNSNCMFSECCICWNPNTQTGACGCYWGIATCKNGNNTTPNLVSSSNFGELNPDARIKFSFEKFSLLFDFFKSKGVKADLLQNTFLNIKSRYALTGQKIVIENVDFAQILSEYSKLIDTLSPKQKEDLNAYIKSLS